MDLRYNLQDRYKSVYDLLRYILRLSHKNLDKDLYIFPSYKPNYLDIQRL